jgi:alginate O-acetyltransferase complex protein AlgI
MQFNAPYFLFLFLPICFIIYFAADRKYKNLVALASSLVFFAWGQLFYLPIMFFIIVINFFLGSFIEKRRGKPEIARRFLFIGVALNLIILITFKLASVYGQFLSLPKGVVEFLLQANIPLGLSYITFQVIAYLIDVNEEVHDSEKNFLNFALYILLFPKIITGPIARYRDIGASLGEREVTVAQVSHGARRFIIGLAKKALIADQLAQIVDPAFALNSPSFTTGIAWLVLLGYALQLYFDFSGYTDMAIGLGQMLGFRFVENFNYPYLARSITDFWRRWHISLSSWFRDYVFVPLEFARRRSGGAFRQQTHILIVFMLTGLWHGVTLNFVLWGLLHGLAIALEMSGFGRWLKKAWAPLQHVYALGVVLFGWVFFRSPTLAYAGQFFARLAGVQQGVTTLPFSQTQPLPIIENSVWLAFALGILFSVPLIPSLRGSFQQFQKRFPVVKWPIVVSYDLILLVLLIASVSATVSANLVASIYGGF